MDGWVTKAVESYLGLKPVVMSCKPLSSEELLGTSVYSTI